MLRGLYTLACIIASLIGAGVGVFFYNQTKYLVPAMGGFAFAWFIEACKSSGATGDSIVGRWGLIIGKSAWGLTLELWTESWVKNPGDNISAGFTVAFFIAGLITTFNYHLILISTAFIGATAFTLGIDCFTRAGLKEFYIYNLGFRSGLFPKLWVQPEGEVGRWVFPLATIMQVELGVLIAVFLVSAAEFPKRNEEDTREANDDDDDSKIGTAIQYRVLGMLQIKLEQIKHEDAERKEAEEEARAAARFKEHDTELGEWESKYGKTKGLNGDVPLVTLGKNGPSSSMHSLVRPYTNAESEGMRDPGSMEMMAQSHSQSDTRSLGGQSVGRLPVMGLGGSISGGDDGRMHSPGLSTADMSPEERERIRLLDEINEVKKSIEVLRSTTPTSVDMLSTAGSMTAGGGTATGTRSRTQSGMSLGGASFASGLGAGATGSLARTAQPSPINVVTPTVAELAQAKKDKEWNDYLAERKLFTPPAGISPPIETSFPHRARQAEQFGRLSKLPDSVVQAMDRRERTVSAYELGVSEIDREDIPQPRSAGLPLGVRHSVQDLRQPELTHQRQSTEPSSRESTYQHNRLSSAPLVTGHAYSTNRAKESVEPINRPAAERTVTHEELTARHRAKLSQLQKPVSESMQEEIRLAEAKAKYEKQKEAERKMMAKKEAERNNQQRPAIGKPERTAGMPDPNRVPRESAVDRAAQWRQSVAAENMQRPVLDTAPEPTSRSRRDNPRASATIDRTSTMEPTNRRQSRGPNQYIN
jgi:hypothetical protein